MNVRRPSNACINLYLHDKAVLSQPPFQILQDNNKKKENFSRLGIQNLGKNFVLGPEEVKLWLHHLRQIEENRRKGPEKKPKFLAKGEKKKVIDGYYEWTK